MANRKQAATVTLLLIVAVAAIASMAVYVMANQPAGQTVDQLLTQGDSPPNGMPGLETRPENQTNTPDGPQL
jgi:hypothetical protein